MGANRRVALVFPGDRNVRESATAENNRFTPLFRALCAAGLQPEPAVYNDDFVEEVRSQLSSVAGVLVWVNPIENGRDRSVLDSMLRDIASRGIFVSAHPDTILKVGTKEVLYSTQDIGWGSDTDLYRNMDEMRDRLALKLGRGEIRVLKQHRGNGGDGVWKVSARNTGKIEDSSEINVRHAKRGSVSYQSSFGEFLRTCEPYFAGSGRMIDQVYQARLPEGMIRCYLVGNKIAGFGHQQINALFPAPAGVPESEAPQPGPRLYHPPTKAEFQRLKGLVENEWVPAMQRKLQIPADELPVIWDTDFMLGKPNERGDDTYVLCEINVSSVAPYPDAAINEIATLTLDRIKKVRNKSA